MKAKLGMECVHDPCKVSMVALPEIARQVDEHICFGTNFELKRPLDNDARKPSVCASNQIE